MAKSPLQKVLDSGVEFTEMSRKQAETIVKQLVKAGEVRKQDADEAAAALLKRSRETTERIADVIQREVNRQVEWMSERFDELEERFEELNGRLRSGGDGVTAKKAPAKKTVAKKAPAKKKSPAKKSTAAKRAATDVGAAPAKAPPAAPDTDQAIAQTPSDTGADD